MGSPAGRRSKPRLFPRFLGVLALAAACFLLGVAVDERRHPTPVRQPDVLPMPNAWQLRIAPPGSGDFSPISVFGVTLADALKSAGRDPKEFQQGASWQPYWLATDPCRGEGVQMICAAVVNPQKLDSLGNVVPR